MITGTPVCVRRPATAAEAVAESWRNGLAEAQKTLETPADKRRECSMLVSFRPITYLTAGIALLEWPPSFPTAGQP
jgi:hypothetical protein